MDTRRGALIAAGVIPPPATEKRCRHCETQKPVTDFPANRRTKDGLSSWCRSCHYEATRRWKAEHPDYGHDWRAKQKQRRGVMGELSDAIAAL